jgi:hypothetical protein
MRIGLIGAPGSGKTDLAWAIEKAISGNVNIVDEYVMHVEAEFNYKADRWATYIVNLAIAIERFKWEREAQDEFPVLVTCGTVLDTTVYMAAEVELMADPGHEGWQRRSVASLATIGCMVDDLYTYDYSFYLPCKTEPGDSFHRTINSELPTALRLFEIPHITLDQDSTDQQLAHVLNAIGSPATADQ